MALFAKDIEVEEIYKSLGKPDGKIEKLFESMKDVYMLALVLGAVNDERIPLKKRSPDSIKEEIFREDNKRIMDLIALNLTKDINILKNTNDSEEIIHNIVEEYSNGGIRILSELLKTDYENLDNLIAVVKEYEENDSKPLKIDLADLLFEVSEDYNR